MIVFIYIILGLIISYYTWKKFFVNIKNHLNVEDFDATKILFFIFGLILWPIYLIEFIKQKWC